MKKRKKEFLARETIYNLKCKGFVLWTGSDAQSPCAEENFFVLCIAFFVFISGWDVEWIRKRSTCRRE